MATKNSQNGVVNFLKVSTVAATRPTRLLTGAMAVGAAVVAPQIAIPVLLAGGLAVVGMSWADINDPDFISQVLKPKTTEPTHNQQLHSLVSRLENRIKSGKYYTEVEADLSESIEALRKITETIELLSAEDKGNVSFVVEQIGKLVDRLIHLTDKEQLARKFLESDDLSRLEEELKSLQSNMHKITDRVTLNQIQKVIKQKESQIETHLHVEQQLGRIDAFIAGIKEALFSTYSNLTKLQLKDDYSLIDEGEVLTASMQQIMDEIDALEDLTFDINSPQNSSQKEKTRRKIPA